MHTAFTDDRSQLREHARSIRISIVEAVAAARSSHIGSALSCVEILTALYFRSLRIDPRHPRDSQRDRFVMSKAHAGIALYATLAERGFFPADMLRRYYIDDGALAGHADAHGVPGIEVSAGSLGHGLAIAVGMALRARRWREQWRAFVLLSDGECDEGSTWEAALLAGHLAMENLIAIIDYNGLQGMAPTSDVVRLDPLADKWRAFGWATVEVDGHNFDEIVDVLGAVPLESNKPTAVIARTVKGKGVSFMEGQVLWHYRSPSGDELDRALRELRG